MLSTNEQILQVATSDETYTELHGLAPNAGCVSVEPAAPLQIALDNIAKALAALLGEAIALTDLEADRGLVEIQLYNVPAAIWHAFPQQAAYSSIDHRSIWKYIAQSGYASIVAFCEHRAACPDLPGVKAQP